MFKFEFFVIILMSLCPLIHSTAPYGLLSPDKQHYYLLSQSTKCQFYYLTGAYNLIQSKCGYTAVNGTACAKNTSILVASHDCNCYEIVTLYISSCESNPNQTDPAFECMTHVLSHCGTTDSKRLLTQVFLMIVGSCLICNFLCTPCAISTINANLEEIPCCLFFCLPVIVLFLPRHDHHTTLHIGWPERYPKLFLLINTVSSLALVGSLVADLILLYVLAKGPTDTPITMAFLTNPRALLTVTSGLLFWAMIIYKLPSRESESRLFWYTFGLLGCLLGTKFIFLLFALIQLFVFPYLILTEGWSLQLQDLYVKLSLIFQVDSIISGTPLLFLSLIEFIPTLDVSFTSGIVIVKFLGGIVSFFVLQWALVGIHLPDPEPVHALKDSLHAALLLSTEKDQPAPDTVVKDLGPTPNVLGTLPLPSIDNDQPTADALEAPVVCSMGDHGPTPVALGAIHQTEDFSGLASDTLSTPSISKGQPPVTLEALLATDKKDDPASAVLALPIKANVDALQSPPRPLKGPNLAPKVVDHVHSWILTCGISIPFTLLGMGILSSFPPITSGDFLVAYVYWSFMWCVITSGLHVCAMAVYHVTVIDIFHKIALLFFFGGRTPLIAAFCVAAAVGNDTFQALGFEYQYMVTLLYIFAPAFLIWPLVELRLTQTEWERKYKVSAVDTLAIFSMSMIPLITAAAGAIILGWTVASYQNN